MTSWLDMIRKGFQGESGNNKVTKCLKNKKLTLIVGGTLKVKNQFFFDFLKVHNELGKVTKFSNSRHLFSWRNSHLEKVQAQSNPLPLGLNFNRLD